MDEITIQELRTHSGDVIDRVTAGETLTVTRAGKPVAELRPVDRTPLAIDVVAERWARLPRIDPLAMRQELDEIIDASL